ncbi:MAG TPA: hypothetical protein VK480_07740 [Solirubrobacterales bacterium]|nr:hypothetical protein [Solirubrobacterales bacterium]
MNWARWRRFGVAAVVVGTLFCGHATAAMAQGEADTGGFGSFRLQGTHGYSIVVLANSQPQFRHGELLLFVYTPHASAIYFTRATVTATEIEADLGALGEVSLEFQPGQGTTVRSHCNPKRRLPLERGAWVGKFEFRGEEGFTRATETRVPASLPPFFDPFCLISAGSGETRGPGLPGARLGARAGHRHHAVSLQANQNRPGAPLYLSASIREQRGQISIERQVEDVYGGNGFEFDPDLRTARLSPPLPFSGVAIFHRDAKPSNRWTGNLILDFPGHSNVALTGTRFQAHLVHAHLTR